VSNGQTQAWTMLSSLSVERANLAAQRTAAADWSDPSCPTTILPVKSIVPTFLDRP
jgi:hypothetical protein